MTKNQRILRLIQQLPPDFTPLPAEWFYALTPKNRRRMEKNGRM